MDIKTIYEKSQYEWVEFAESDYNPMLNAIGNVAVKVEEDGYQGDTWVLYDNDGKFGYLNFGWGSCSGCDALQACDTFKEAQDLFDYIERQVIWFESIDDAMSFIQSDARTMDYAWSSEDFKTFISKSETYLKNKIGGNNE